MSKKLIVTWHGIKHISVDILNSFILPYGTPKTALIRPFKILSSLTVVNHFILKLKKKDDWIAKTKFEPDSGFIQSRVSGKDYLRPISWF